MHEVLHAKLDYISCLILVLDQTILLLVNIIYYTRNVACLGTDHLIFDGGGAQIRKKYRARQVCKTNILQKFGKKYRAEPMRPETNRGASPLPPPPIKNQIVHALA